VWLKGAPTKVDALWQLSQARLVGGWLGGLFMLPRAKRPPEVWHEAHSRGVPRKTPLRWHDSQRVKVCAPVSAKPVRR